MPRTVYGKIILKEREMDRGNEGKKVGRREGENKEGYRVLYAYHFIRLYPFILLHFPSCSSAWYCNTYLCLILLSLFHWKVPLWWRGFALCPTLFESSDDLSYFNILEHTEWKNQEYWSHFYLKCLLFSSWILY